MTLTTTFNWLAFLGWTAVLAMTAGLVMTPSGPSPQLLHLVLLCEIICASETVKIALGILRGDLALSFTVHYTRFLMYFVTLPHADVNPSVVKTILLAWSLTEFFRYPMVLFPGNATLKSIRYMAPLITFPLGAGTEAFAAWKVFLASDSMAWKAILGMVIVINVGGGTLWYPSMVAKVTRSLKGKSAAKKKE